MLLTAHQCASSEAEPLSGMTSSGMSTLQRVSVGWGVTPGVGSGLHTPTGTGAHSPGNTCPPSAGTSRALRRQRGTLRRAYSFNTRSETEAASAPALLPLRPIRRSAGVETAAALQALLPVQQKALAAAAVPIRELVSNGVAGAAAPAPARAAGWPRSRGPSRAASRDSLMVQQQPAPPSAQFGPLSELQLVPAPPGQTEPSVRVRLVIQIEDPAAAAAAAVLNSRTTSRSELPTCGVSAGAEEAAASVRLPLQTRVPSSSLTRPVLLHSHSQKGLQEGNASECWTDPSTLFRAELTRAVVVSTPIHSVL